jgi:hypothetical protein
LASIAGIVGAFLRTAKHRPLVVWEQPRSSQPISLNLRTQVWREVGRVRKTDLITGIHLVHSHQLALFQQGRLPPP